jgi:hypothetical protein
VKRELKKVWLEHYADALPVVVVQFNPADVINSLHPSYVPQKMPYSQFDLLKHVFEKYELLFIANLHSFDCSFFQFVFSIQLTIRQFGSGGNKK